MIRIPVFAIAAVLLLGAAASHTDVADCDRLTSHPEDPDRAVPGVDTKDVDLPRAIAACEAAAASLTKESPAYARIQYQLGRAYFYDQQTAKAVPALERSAEAGYRQTQFVLGYIIDAELQGVAADPCRVEDLWVRSARAGRLAAEVSYPNNVMLGRFKGCKIQANDAEMGAFLEAAGKHKGLDFYQRLLVSVLEVNLGRYLSDKAQQ